MSDYNWYTWAIVSRSLIWLFIAKCILGKLLWRKKDSPIKQTVPALNLISVPSKKVTDATMFSQPDLLIEAP